MPGTFQIYKDKKGEYRFRLKATNGQNILASEGYRAKPSVKNGIASVQKNAGDAKRFEVKTQKNGKAYFVLKGGNGQVIGKSEAYESEAACKNGMASVKTNAKGAKVDDTTAVAAKKTAAKKAPAKKAAKKAAKKKTARKK